MNRHIITLSNLSLSFSDVLLELELYWMKKKKKMTKDPKITT